MELYINVKDKFLLWDYLHLNSQIFDINFSNVKVQNPDTDKYKDVTDTIKVTLKDNRQDEWAQRRQLRCLAHPRRFRSSEKPLFLRLQRSRHGSG